MSWSYLIPVALLFAVCAGQTEACGCMCITYPCPCARPCSKVDIQKLMMSGDFDGESLQFDERKKYLQTRQPFPLVWSGELDDMGSGDSQYFPSAGLRLRRRRLPKRCQRANAQYEYTRRVYIPGLRKWDCPLGWKDNHCDWIDGNELGELQCKRKVSSVSPMVIKLQDLERKGKVYLSGQTVTQEVTQNSAGLSLVLSAAKKGVEYGLKMIPTVGPILSSLLSFFFGAEKLSIETIWEKIAPKVNGIVGTAIFKSEMQDLLSDIKRLAELAEEVQAVDRCRHDSSRTSLVGKLEDLASRLQQDLHGEELDRFTGKKLFARLSIFAHVSVMAILAKLDGVERIWHETKESKKSNVKHCQTTLHTLKMTVHKYLTNAEAEIALLKEWQFEYFSNSLDDYSPIQWKAFEYKKRRKFPCRHQCYITAISCGDDNAAVGVTSFDLPQTLNELNEQCPAKRFCTRPPRGPRRNPSCTTSRSFACPTYSNQLSCMNMKRAAKESFDQKWNDALVQPLQSWLKFIDRLSTKGYCQVANRRSSSKRPEIMGTKSFLATMDNLSAKRRKSRQFVKLWKKVDGKNACA